MTERKWTKGPWVVDTPIGEDLPWVNAECNHTLDENGVEQYMSVSGSCGMANARLIAAAPELYEALEDLFKELTLGDFELPSSLKPEIAQAAKALAKARGEK